MGVIVPEERHEMHQASGFCGERAFALTRGTAPHMVKAIFMTPPDEGVSGRLVGKEAADK
jgi:hypothetical protein